MEYADLRVLEAVARHGSMNRATAELHTVQPNVSADLRERRYPADVVEAQRFWIRLTMRLGLEITTGPTNSWRDLHLWIL
jgi:hypothetical protein